MKTQIFLIALIFVSAYAGTVWDPLTWDLLNKDLKSLYAVKKALPTSGVDTYFNPFDTDANGAFTEAEFTAALNSFWTSYGVTGSVLEIKAKFTAWDTSKDKSVQKAEFAAAFPAFIEESITACRNALATALIKRIWGSDSLTLVQDYYDKMSAMVAAGTEADLVTFFTLYDANANGFLDTKEFTNVNIDLFGYFGKKLPDKTTLAAVALCFDTTVDSIADSINQAEFIAGTNKFITSTVAYLLFRLNDKVVQTTNAILQGSKTDQTKLSASLTLLQNIVIPDFVTAAFAAFDANANGVLESTEFTLWWQSFLVSLGLSKTSVASTIVFTAWGVNNVVSPSGFATGFAPFLEDLIRDSKVELFVTVVEDLWSQDTQSNLLRSHKQLLAVRTQTSEVFAAAVFKRYDTKTKNALLNLEEYTNAVQYILAYFGKSLKDPNVNDLICRSVDTVCGTSVSVTQDELTAIVDLFLSTSFKIIQPRLAETIFQSIWNFNNRPLFLKALNHLEEIKEQTGGYSAFVKTNFLASDENKNKVLDMTEFTKWCTDVFTYLEVPMRLYKNNETLQKAWDTDLNNLLTENEIKSGFARFLTRSVDIIQEKISDIIEVELWRKDSATQLIFSLTQLKSVKKKGYRTYVGELLVKWDGNADGAFNYTEFINAQLDFYSYLGKPFTTTTLPAGVFEAWDNNLNDLMTTAEFEVGLRDWTEDSIASVQDYIELSVIRDTWNGDSIPTLLESLGLLRTLKTTVSDYSNTLFTKYDVKKKNNYLDSAEFALAITEFFAQVNQPLVDTNFAVLLYSAWDSSLNEYISSTELQTGLVGFVSLAIRAIQLNTTTLFRKGLWEGADQDTFYNSLVVLKNLRKNNAATYATNLYKTYDTDKNKVLDASEFTSAINEFFTTIGRPSVDAANLLFQTWDDTLSGSISERQIRYGIYYFDWYAMNELREKLTASIIEATALSLEATSTLAVSLREIKRVRTLKYQVYTDFLFTSFDLSLDNNFTNIEYAGAVQYVFDGLQLVQNDANSVAKLWDSLDINFNGLVANNEFAYWIRRLFDNLYTRGLKAAATQLRGDISAQVTEIVRSAVYAKVSAIKASGYSSYSNTLFKSVDLAPKNSRLDVNEWRAAISGFATYIGVTGFTLHVDDAAFVAWDTSISEDLTSGEFLNGLKPLVDGLIADLAPAPSA